MPLCVSRSFVVSRWPHCSLSFWQLDIRSYSNASEFLGSRKLCRVSAANTSQTLPSLARIARLAQAAPRRSPTNKFVRRAIAVLVHRGAMSWWIFLRKFCTAMSAMSGLLAFLELSYDLLAAMPAALRRSASRRRANLALTCLARLDLRSLRCWLAGSARLDSARLVCSHHQLASRIRLQSRLRCSFLHFSFGLLQLCSLRSMRCDEGSLFRTTSVMHLCAS